jgi:hypothetical protein
LAHGFRIQSLVDRLCFFWACGEAEHQGGACSRGNLFTSWWPGSKKRGERWDSNIPFKGMTPVTYVLSLGPPLKVPSPPSVATQSLGLFATQWKPISTERISLWWASWQENGQAISWGPSLLTVKSEELS